MKPRWPPDQELVAFVVLVALTIIGSWLRSNLLVLLGALGALAMIGLFLWQRWCLVGLAYDRGLSISRAQFGEEVELKIELINDKLLPLPWVKVEDEVPPSLGIEGAAARVLDPYNPTIVDESGFFIVAQTFAMLPFQRIRRSITIRCQKRGRHRFGDSIVSSGDPLGFRHRDVRIERADDLLVYPKLFALAPAAFLSRAPIGHDRSLQPLMSDPTRVAGMRAYRSGDPLRHIDWRSTARRGELLVRDFEPSTTLRVAIFLDLDVRDGEPASDSVLEFRISLVASMLATLTEQGLAVGLFAPGKADEKPVGHAPSSAPTALAAMLELLALCAPDPSDSLADVLARETTRIESSSIVLVVASDFTETTLLALAQCRRRAPVIAIFVDAHSGRPPERELIDQRFNVEFRDDWRDQSSLQLTP